MLDSGWYRYIETPIMAGGLDFLGLKLFLKLPTVSFGSQRIGVGAP